MTLEKMSSSRPYLIRALHEWIIDNGLTPYLLVDAKVQDTHVPTQYVKEGHIVLNLSPQAIQRLHLGNQEITFSARFGGVSYDVVVPSGAVLAIYTKENGEGMVFRDQVGGGPAPEGPAPQPGKPKLRVVR